MTDPHTIQLLWQYMRFADNDVLSASQGLGDPGYYREQGISSGSVHKLMVHCMSAQASWLQRLTSAATPQPIDPASIARHEIAERWSHIHETLRAFANAQTSATLAQNIRSVNRMGTAFVLPVGLCMLHVSDHASYHRGQLNSMIKLAGAKPSAVMLYSFGLKEGIGYEEPPAAKPN